MQGQGLSSETWRVTFWGSSQPFAWVSEDSPGAGWTSRARTGRSIPVHALGHRVSELILVSGLPVPPQGAFAYVLRHTFGLAQPGPPNTREVRRGRLPHAWSCPRQSRVRIGMQPDTWSLFFPGERPWSSANCLMSNAQADARDERATNDGLSRFAAISPHRDLSHARGTEDASQLPSGAAEPGTGSPRGAATNPPREPVKAHAAVEVVEAVGIEPTSRNPRARSVYVCVPRCMCRTRAVRGRAARAPAAEVSRRSALRLDSPASPLVASVRGRRHSPGDGCVS